LVMLTKSNNLILTDSTKAGPLIRNVKYFHSQNMKIFNEPLLLLLPVPLEFLFSQSTVTG